jgi:hypothetical protein
MELQVHIGGWLLFLFDLSVCSNRLSCLCACRLPAFNVIILEHDMIAHSTGHLKQFSCIVL